MSPFWHGFFLAFSLILPLGVQNVFIFFQGATQPLHRALTLVVVAALCDTLLISLAVSGVSVAVVALPWVKWLLTIGGALFLLYMGWNYWRQSDLPQQQEKNTESLKQSILFAMTVSLLNPHAILDTIAVIGTSSLLYDGERRLQFACAAVLVSWIWFFGLALTGRLIQRLEKSGLILLRMQQGSAIMMWFTAGLLIYYNFQ